MEPDIILSSNGVIALIVVLSVCAAIPMIALIVATFQNETLEKKLAKTKAKLAKAKKKKGAQQ